jgi:putative peptidoglycan lipid II flippase
MALSVAFAITLLRTGWAPAHAGIAAATACSALLNAALLLQGLRRSGVYRARPGWTALVVRVLLPSVALALALVAGASAIGDWYLMTTLERLAALAVLVIGGAAVYFAACHLVGLRASELKRYPTV